MALALQPPPHELNPLSADEISTDNGEQLSFIGVPEKERLHRLLPPCREIYLISAKLTLFLILAISYLTFCFVVHYYHVPIGRSGIPGLPFLPHFSTASVITTVAILIVYVALWPMKGAIDEIRAEEFFRLMHTHPNGVPLDTVNAVSATTTGAFDIFMATIHRHCSPLLASTLVISLVITATSLVAPAALSLGPIGIDVGNSTISIGAVPNASFLVDYGYNSGIELFGLQSLRKSMAPTMAWIENFLNLTNGYYMVTSSEGDQLEYLVPFPPGYISTMKAHWTTDIIVLDPVCSWQTATTTGSINDSNLYVMLHESNLHCSLSSGGYELVSSPFNMTQISWFVCDNASTTEFSVPVDGSALLIIDQLNLPELDTGTRPVDLSFIPTLKLSTGNVLAFLLCSPRVVIRTYQVSATGNGTLTLGERQQSTGNIDFIQANYLLTFILHDSKNNSGPTSDPLQVGTDLILRLVFGTNTVTLDIPAPLTNITAVYKQIIHSAMKTMLSGALGTQNVPGAYTEEQMVFMSSLGHVITSAILFAFLTIALVAAQFRKGRVAFTFVNVAAALADSDAPQKCVEMTQFKAGTGERKVLKLVPGGDGRLYCVYESLD